MWIKYVKIIKKMSVRTQKVKYLDILHRKSVLLKRDKSTARLFKFCKCKQLYQIGITIPIYKTIPSHIPPISLCLKYLFTYIEKV